MITEFIETLKPKLAELENHQLYGHIQSINDLQLFMDRHVYAVFDFMSLTKALQNELAPSGGIWTMPKSNKLARFINEIVLCEESDELPSGEFISHFEMYCRAMAEVKANSDLPLAFIHYVSEHGLKIALNEFDIPKCSRTFMDSTFATLKAGRIHEIAASFCFGREKCIPIMFQTLLDQMNISEKEAPTFHYYLKRHIEVDGDSHGPLALNMIEHLCGDDKGKWNEALNAANSSIDNRIQFWDEVLIDIKKESIV